MSPRTVPARPPHAWCGRLGAWLRSEGGRQALLTVLALLLAGSLLVIYDRLPPQPPASRGEAPIPAVCACPMGIGAGPDRRSPGDRAARRAC